MLLSSLSELANKECGRQYGGRCHLKRVEVDSVSLGLLRHESRRLCGSVSREEKVPIVLQKISGARPDLPP